MRRNDTGNTSQLVLTLRKFRIAFRPFAWSSATGSRLSGVAGSCGGGVDREGRRNDDGVAGRGGRCGWVPDIMWALRGYMKKETKKEKNTDALGFSLSLQCVRLSENIEVSRQHNCCKQTNKKEKRKKRKKGTKEKKRKEKS